MDIDKDHSVYPVLSQNFIELSLSSNIAQIKKALDICPYVLVTKREDSKLKSLFVISAKDLIRPLEESLKILI